MPVIGIHSNCLFSSMCDTFVWENMWKKKSTGRHVLTFVFPPYDCIAHRYTRLILHPLAGSEQRSVGASKLSAMRALSCKAACELVRGWISFSLPVEMLGAVHMNLFYSSEQFRNIRVLGLDWKQRGYWSQSLGTLKKKKKLHLAHSFVLACTVPPSELMGLCGLARLPLLGSGLNEKKSEKHTHTHTHSCAHTDWSC